jgi:hypothetical protein
MKISKVLGTVAGLASSIYWTGVVSAQGVDGILPDGPMDQEFIPWIQSTLNTVIFLAALVCVAILIAAGYSYITAAGDEQKIEKATKTLTYAIVGLVICFISVILVRFVLGLLGN